MAEKQVCECGCGQEVKLNRDTKKPNRFICGHYNKGKTKEISKSIKKMSETKTGRTKETHKYIKAAAEKTSKILSGRTAETHEYIRTTAEKLTGRTKETHEHRRIAGEKISKKKKNRTKKNDESVARQAKKLVGRTKENDKGRRIASEKISKTMSGRTKETHEYIRITAEKTSIRMKNGGAAHACSFIKDDSKPENELFILACKVLPRPIHKYPIYRVGKGKRSYNADIADPSLGIILEFDGYFHFCDQEHINYHKKRQEEIEEEGWKFIRYTIFDKFPTKEQILEDIKKVLWKEN